MPSAGFEPETPATKRPQTYALDRAATEVGSIRLYGAKCQKTAILKLNPVSLLFRVVLY
jgi:hypothetical protein